MSTVINTHNFAQLDLSEHTNVPGAGQSTQRGYHNSWRAALAMHAEGDGLSIFRGSMAETAAAPQSPRHLHKRRRLSRLLDKLAVQLRNNNHYPPTPTPWLRIDAPAKPSTLEPTPSSSGNASEQPRTDEGPLDLSVKSEVPPPPKPAPEPTFSCGACGQTFALQHRLMKHVASRHRSRATEPARVYACDVCSRKFARSDMLTRHARLHSGLKPYACVACGQVFSRSDHLATHQRTHTGEKPYRCPACPYAACRRDMITRHMRTHTRRPQPV